MELDLAYLRDLLRVLKDEGVASFALPEMTVSFSYTEPLTPARVAQAVSEDDYEETPAVPRNQPLGFKHPSLWSAQNGKTLRLDGTFE